MEGFEQRQAADVTDEHMSARPRHAKRFAQHGHQILRVGKILSDRVEDDEIDALVFEEVEVVGQPLPELHGPEVVSRHDVPAERLEHARREVDADVAIALPASRVSNRPVPHPISTTRRAPSARSDRTVSSTQIRISSIGSASPV